jgi:hypothetical protein
LLKIEKASILEQKLAKTYCYQKRGPMKEKDIKRIVKKQLKSKHPNWHRIPRKRKKEIAKEITDNVIAGYHNHDKELDIPIEELIGIEQQQPDRRIISLDQMAVFIDNFYTRAGLINFNTFRKPWPEIHNKELRFIDELLDDRIINALLANEGYSPQMRDIFPCQLFRAELLKSIKYPEISYRKYCTNEYMGQERKENRRFLGLPLNTKKIINHTELSKFRSSLEFHQLVNILVYILHHFYSSNLLENCVFHGVDSTEIANDNSFPLYSINLGKKKVRIYSDIDCDCGARRSKRDKSKYVVGYRMHTLTAINPSTGHSFPFVSLLGPANHHDSLYLKPLVELAQAMGIEMKLITADKAYNDLDGSLLADNNVHLITPVPSDAVLPDNVESETLNVTCDNQCEIPMIRMGLTDEGHEYKCAAEPGECPSATICKRYRIIAFDKGHFQRMPMNSELAKQAVEMRKNSERPFNLLKKREGLENAKVRSQHALIARITFTQIATLLIEMGGLRKKIQKIKPLQLKLFKEAA